MLKRGLLTRIKKSQFEGYNSVGNFSHIYHCEVGRMTYIGSRCSLLYTKIGRFCSIAGNVKVVVGGHPTREWISTHPVFYSPKSTCGISFVNNVKFKEFKYVDNEHKFMVEIGNDVWVGSDVIILGGVTIGDGAIIGAGAVVTKSVDPNTIVGGVPARKIGQRFDDEVIQYLMQKKWWQYDIGWIREHANSFENISDFMKIFG